MSWLDPTPDARTIEFVGVAELRSKVLLLTFYYPEMQGYKHHYGSNDEPKTVGKKSESKDQEQKREVDRIATKTKKAGFD